MDYEALEDRYSDKLERQEACEQAHEAQATAEIRAAWAAFFSGTGTRVPVLRHRSGGLCEEVNEPATEAMHDMLYDGAPQAALVALLQGRGDVQALRDAIVADYIYRHAQDIAQERAANDPMPFPAFLTQGATA